MSSNYRKLSAHRGAHGIMFHHFYDKEFYRSEGSITAENLADIIEFVGATNIISADEWLDRCRSNSLEKNHICLSFDDALLCQYEIAIPVLESFNKKAFFFVYSSVIKGGHERLELFRYLRNVCYQSIDNFYDEFFSILESGPYSDLLVKGLSLFPGMKYLEQYPFYSLNDRKYRYVRDNVLGVDLYNKIVDSILKNKIQNICEISDKIWMREKHILTLAQKGHQIGLHSYSHPMKMRALTEFEQETEYYNNYNHLKSILGITPQSMSHPCNSYSDITLGILRKIGIRVGFCATMQFPNRGELEFPREDHANIMRILK